MAGSVSRGEVMMGIVGLIGIGGEPADIRVQGVTKWYPDGTEAVKNVSLDVQPGESLALVGPRGAGKSTLLSIIAGDQPASAGLVTIGGEPPDELPSAERQGLVRVQAEFRPDVTVRENLADALASLGMGRRRITRAIQSAAESLGIQDLLGRYPRDLSPGQQERALLAKVMVTPASAYLVDPTLSGPTGAGVEGPVEALREQRRATVVYATTEPQEAISLGGRMAVMYDGSVEQVGEARVILDDPHTLNVARIVPSVGSAFVSGEIVGGSLRLPEGDFTVPPHLREAIRPFENRRVVLRVTDERLGGQRTSGALRALLGQARHVGPASGLPFDPSRILAFDADSGDRIAVGEPAVIVTRPVDQTPTAAGDDLVQAVRAVNAWLIGTRPPIPVGQEVTVGFNVGPAVRDVLASAPFSEPDWGGVEEMECDVTLLSDGCDVSPPGQKLTVPRLGPSPSVHFRIRALDSGPVALRFQIYLASAGLLLQELTTTIEAVSMAEEVSA
jgi:multiple sugar transport system ATP-binding protein